MVTRLLIDAGSFLGKVWALAAPYWKSEERLRAWGLLIAVVGLTLGLVYMAVLFNTWNREFYNSLEQKNYQDFAQLILYFCFLAAVYIVAAVYRLYLRQMLTMRWRVWLTHQYLGEWLERQVYYRLELDHHGTDNPDQRIAEDLRLFTDGALALGLGLLNAVVTLVSFVAILWAVSGPLEFAVAGTDLSVPGYMVWVAVLYALLASFASHFIGRPLIGVNFRLERMEADLRFGLVRLRENAEGVALYRGEAPERRNLAGRIEGVRETWWALMHYTKRLTYFTAGYTQVAIVFPFVVAAPRFFSGAITLGGLTQIANAFGEVQGALSWFVNSYADLANWKASVDRLLSFKNALDAVAREAGTAAGFEVETAGAGALAVQDLELSVPQGGGIPGRVLLAGAQLALRPGERVLLSGPSGSGKSTLVRAIAGIGPYARGRVVLPQGTRALFLPQKPYLPIGTLRAAVCYPAEPRAFGDDAVRTALQDCRLAHLAPSLDEPSNWSMRLSLGEQQRLALARALLHRPDWLFLDEATASMDEALEAQMYSLVRAKLPQAAVFSIAHRPQVARFHARRYDLVPAAEGASLVDRGPIAQPG
ncbi:MAG: ABC transporter ATP-binding protein/permease [Burkholderiales bacterium]|nr:ABC transporter ATP-binding protein/permease [Burkholderiales bacterium]